MAKDPAVAFSQLYRPQALFTHNNEDWRSCAYKAPRYVWIRGLTPKEVHSPPLMFPGRGVPCHMFESFLELSHVHCAYPAPGGGFWILELHSSQFHEPNSRLRQEIAVDFGLLAGLVGEEVVLPLCENLGVFNAVHPHTFLYVCAACSSSSLADQFCTRTLRASGMGRISTPADSGRD